MAKIIVFLAALVTATAWLPRETPAQQAIRLITPTKAGCRDYTTAVVGHDQRQLDILSGWYIGYLSGAAQGSGVNFLQDQDSEPLLKRLFELCTKRADEPLSRIAAEIAKSLMDTHQGR